ncbi:antitoxin [mine drainage metagenome]|uniref:Antitoxin n=1 Tax=mine drainage metagenome TaxID=410659 RepID=T0ZKD1_9ZZZZ
MPSVLIRNVPDEVIAAIDGRAAALGLSRNEYLRRRLRQEAQHGASTVEVDDLGRFETMFGDLADRAVMARAWS